MTMLIFFNLESSRNSPVTNPAGLERVLIARGSRAQVVLPKYLTPERVRIEARTYVEECRIEGILYDAYVVTCEGRMMTRVIPLREETRDEVLRVAESGYAHMIPDTDEALQPEREAASTHGESPALG